MGKSDLTEGQRADASTLPAEPAGQVHRPHPGYLLYLLVALAAGIYLTWMLSASFDWVIAFFLAMCLACAMWAAWHLLSRVVPGARGLDVHFPLGRAVHVDYRQFAEVAPGGRFLPNIVVIYYPLRADGLLDLDDFRSLNLPAVEGRELLLAQLQRHTPR